MKEKYIRPNICIYLIGITWVIYALIFPLYRITDYIIAAAASIAVYFVSALLFGKKKIYVAQDTLELTDDEKLNETIKQANEYITKLKTAGMKLSDDKINAKINNIIDSSIKIFSYVRENPSQRNEVRRFINYYLPTTLKLIETYTALEAQNIETENISQTMEKIDKMLDTIIEAFKNRLDSLYEDKAIDISTDISVMESVMKSEGLIKDDIKVEK